MSISGWRPSRRGQAAEDIPNSGSYGSSTARSRPRQGSHQAHRSAGQGSATCRTDGSPVPFPTAKLFDDANSIVFAEGSWAVWNILHLGGPPHPFHIHMTQFQMIERGQWDLAALGDDGWNADNGTTGVLPIPADSAITPDPPGHEGHLPDQTR